MDHLHAGAGQRLAAGQHVAVGGGDDGLFGVHLIDDHVVHAVGHGLVHAHAGGGVGLRVKVAQQHLFALLRHRRRQIHAGGGLAHAALLIHDLSRFFRRWKFRHPILPP